MGPAPRLARLVARPFVLPFLPFLLPPPFLGSQLLLPQLEFPLSPLLFRRPLTRQAILLLLADVDEALRMRRLAKSVRLQRGS
jgi:hypothetical protein